MQGGPLSSLIFNVVVGAVIREWLWRRFDVEAARSGLMIEQTAVQMVSCYVDNGVLSALDPMWLQSTFNVLIILFKRVGLKTNAKKTQVMMCIPGKIRESWTEEVYHDSRLGCTLSTGWKRLQVDCKICSERLQASSLQSHLEMQYNIYCSFVLNRDLSDVAPATFCANINTATGEYACLVPGCIGTAHTEYNLRFFFVMHHPTHLVIIPKEGSMPFLQCHLCGVQTPVEALSKGHTQTKLC
jgi:hypothetical protein